MAIHDGLFVVGSAQGVLLFDDLKSPASSFAIQAQEVLPATDQDMQENKPLDLRCVAISPDENLLATGSDDYAIRLWLVDEILAHASLPVSGQKVPLPANVDSQDLADASAADGLSLNPSAPEVQKEPATHSPNRSRSPGNKSGGEQSPHPELAFAIIFLAVFSLLLIFSAIAARNVPREHLQDASDLLLSSRSAGWVSCVMRTVVRRLGESEGPPAERRVNSSRELRRGQPIVLHKVQEWRDWRTGVGFRQGREQRFVVDLWPAGLSGTTCGCDWKPWTLRPFLSEASELIHDPFHTADEDREFVRQTIVAMAGEGQAL